MEGCCRREEEEVAKRSGQGRGKAGARMGILYGPIPASELFARPQCTVVFSHMENEVGLLRLQVRHTLTEMMIFSPCSAEFHSLCSALMNIMVST